MTDNATFTKWLNEFQRLLIDRGMPVTDAMKFKDERLLDAMRRFHAGDSPREAAVKEQPIWVRERLE